MAPAPVFPQALAMLIGFWVNGLLHGMYLILFFRWVLLQWNQKKQGGGANKYYAITSWGIFILSNIDTGINFALLILGYWETLGDGSGGPIAFFNNPDNWETVWREINYQLIVGLADLMMVHRLWVIWGKNYYLGGFALAIWAVELFFGFNAPARLALGQFEQLTVAINCQLGLNTTLQVVLTALLAYRILYPPNTDIEYLPAEQRYRRKKLVQCFVESGALVTFGVVFDLILYSQNILFHWALNISLAQLYAICTVMIVLRMNDVFRSQNQTGYAGGHSQHMTQPPPPPMPNKDFKYRPSADFNFPASRSILNVDDGEDTPLQAANKAAAVALSRKSSKSLKNHAPEGIVVHVVQEQEVVMHRDVSHYVGQESV